MALAASAPAATQSACGERTINLVDRGESDAGAASGGAGPGGAGGALGGGGHAGGGGGGGGGGDAGASPGACPTYQAACSGACIPTSVDPENCGGCGVTCDQGQVCFAGRCGPSCPPGLVACAGTCVDLKTESAHCNACGHACASGTGCVDGTCRPLLELAPAPERCAGGGPPVTVDGLGQGAPRCAGEIAATTFLWALCACGGVELSNPLLTDGFDSALGPYAPGQLGGSLGVHGGFVNSSTSAIWGSLWASSSEGGVSVGNQTTVLQDLHVGGALSVDNPFFVAFDAFVAGDIEVSSTLTVAGALHHPEGAGITGDVTYGALVSEPVTVPPPCGCDPEQRLPIAAAVAARRPPSNDNAQVGLGPTALVDPDGPVRLELACGRYYLSGIRTNAPLVVAVTGRVALFVDGDVEASAPLAFVVGPAAELDVFVAGSLSSSAALTMGSPAYPALARLYVGGAETSLSLTNDARVGGFVYAAGGKVEASNPLEVFGGVFARDFRNTGPTALHYDRRVLGAGASCAPTAPATCASCKDCGNQACVDGACGACASSAECCAPLVCRSGSCVPVPH